jgi:mannosyl-3-phosphoglycerate phosphatase
VFTDLDGTLLRHGDYDWSAAREAVTALARRRIPLVFASSKTRAEIEVWRARLRNPHPFIAENGGALFVPPGSTPRPPALASRSHGYLRVRFGASYPRLRAALRLLSRQLGVRLRGFGDMGKAEVARLTGLKGDELEWAMEREFDEPFAPIRPLSADEEERLAAAATELGLRVTRGGRFHHLMGPSSKGAAASLLLSAYASPEAPVCSLGLGDAPNDLELLRVVERPIVVARPDGTHSDELRKRLPHARFTRGIGPEGFNEAVLAYLAQPW